MTPVHPQHGIADCPACGVNLIYRRTTFRWLSRVEPVIVTEIWPSALYWRCPDCGATWHRWPAGDRLHQAAEQLR
ncbi:MAG: hypothetical protein ABWY93_18775 [Mycobacterium sp.]